MIEAQKLVPVINYCTFVSVTIHLESEVFFLLSTHNSKYKK